MQEHLKTIPVPTLRRLPLYLKIAQQAKMEGKKVIACPEIAIQCNFDPIQVRKDIASTGIVGQARCGFVIDELIDAVEKFLGWRSENEAFLVGAGHLGTALMKYDKFKEHGLNIVAAFDTDKFKIGKKIGKISILALDKLTNLANRMHIPIGIIAVPVDFAQSVADIMVNAQIKALWNFSPTILKVPQDIIVENVSLISSLGVLTSKLKHQGVCDE